MFSLHGASLERPLGDNLAAIFGVPRLHEDDALRAVRAALELREAVARLNEELGQERAVAIDVRIGIDTGEVLEGDPASPEGLVSGEALGRATRLAQTAGAGEIVISEATHRLVRDVGPDQRRPKRTFEARPVERSSCSISLDRDSPRVPRPRSSGAGASSACSSRRSSAPAAMQPVTSSRCLGHRAWASRASRVSS